jgi:hypothetical protein
MTAPRTPSSRILALSAGLTLLVGCGGPAQDPPDTAEVIRQEPSKPVPTTPEAKPEPTPAKEAPKE